VTVTSTLTSMVDQKQVHALMTSPLKVTSSPGVDGFQDTLTSLSSRNDVEPFRPFLNRALSYSSRPSTVIQRAQSSPWEATTLVPGPLPKKPSQAMRLSDAATGVSSRRNSISEPSLETPAPAWAGGTHDPEP
jgi:hypothetical protein